MAELKQDFAKRTAEAESLRAKVDKAEATLESARSLLGKLGGERDRWVKQVRPRALVQALGVARGDAQRPEADDVLHRGHRSSRWKASWRARRCPRS